MLLTKNEVRFLREMRTMELERAGFGHLRIAKRLGYSSVATVWQYLEQLERKGFMKKGERLAKTACPIVSSAGRRLLKRAA